MIVAASSSRYAEDNMPPKKRERSPSTTPIPTTETPQSDGSQIPKEQWEAMEKVLHTIYEYRTPDGFDPSKLFHRKVNKRLIPEYYETIKEPVALSTLRKKIQTRAYQNFSEYVRDFALIVHNAQVFNRPDSGAFQDALVIREQVERLLQGLVQEGSITKEVATLPDLGEIPTYEDVPMEDAEAEGEDEDESDEEGEEDEEEEEQELDDEGRPAKKRGRGRPPGSVTKVRRGTAGDEGDGKRARGRPPKLLTPAEGRTLAVLKGLRKVKNKQGQLIVKHFDRLPDKTAMPEYYAEVKHPMAYDLLKRNFKRKKYPTLQAFMSDVNLMCNNAKSYNTDDSQIFADAVELQREAGKLFDAEMAKPDNDFVDESGPIPMPNGILHNGELYKVGDWVHLQNINDLTKPIPAQVYRTYKLPSGQNMVNVCWYYRPEQTVHRFDKHFLNNEVVKTGRYRDHPIEDVEGKCFIMFYTRYFKGRPRNLPEGTEIYVCKDRYNEERHQFNTIKTWASCLPDEVRGKDYEMDLFDYTRKMKKYPTPLAYLLRDDQTETDELPKPQWGAEGAPPKVGAVHKRPRNEKDSPPPEPTPPPAPKVETPAPRAPLPQPSTQHQPTNMPISQPQQPRPAMPLTTARPLSYTQQTTVPTPRPTSTPQALPTPRVVAPASSHNNQTSTNLPPNPAQYAPRPTTNYRDPPPIEVYTLPDAANLSIPFEIREQFQKDAAGRVLFFTTPPVATPEITESRHSIRYLAAKARAAKRKSALTSIDVDEEPPQKISRPTDDDDDNATMKRDIELLTKRAFHALGTQLAETVDRDMSDRDLSNLSAAQRAMREQMGAVEANGVKRREVRRVRLEIAGDGLGL